MVKVFVDFDGTITKFDVGDAMFETLGGGRYLNFVAEYHSEKISAIECFHRGCKLCGDVDKLALDVFLDRQELDTAFGEFLKFCKEQAFDCTIVSDGMDYYIRRILDKHGIDVPFVTNHLELVPVDGTSLVRFQPSFPFTDEVCDRCAFCKRNYILTTSADDDIVVYVGEGYSDRCPARYADVIFAKDDLLTYCQHENIPYFEYTSFADVTTRLGRMVAAKGTGKKNSLHKRRQAQLARREVYTGG